MQTIKLQNPLGHLRTITRHKREVGRLMRCAGLPLQGALHDLSKYSPMELGAGFGYYQGFRSPNAAERESLGYSNAWLHHKGRNRHHFEYWIDFIGPNTVLPEGASPHPIGGGVRMVAAPMPTRYVVEMFCDRVAASKVYQGGAYTDASALEYLKAEIGRSGQMMHPDTLALIYFLLEMLSQQGEERTLSYIRTNIVRTRFAYGFGGRF